MRNPWFSLLRIILEWFLAFVYGHMPELLMHLDLVAFHGIGLAGLYIVNVHVRETGSRTVYGWPELLNALPSITTRVGLWCLIQSNPFFQELTRSFWCM